MTAAKLNTVNPVNKVLRAVGSRLSRLKNYDGDDRGVTAFFRRIGLQLLKTDPSDDTDLYVKLYGEEGVKHRRFYNIAAGVYKGFGGVIDHPCWTNIDVDRSWKNDRNFPGGREYDASRDIAHDLLSVTRIPVESSSAELVHSRFTVDRLTDEAAQYFFNEVHRMLKDGGVFRIVSTNLDVDFRAYLSKDHDFYFWLNESISMEQCFLFHVVTQLSARYFDSSTTKVSDEEFRDIIHTMDYESAATHLVSKCSLEVHKRNRYDHFNWWNQRKFERMLGLAGFDAIYVSAPQQSATPVLRNPHFFDNEHNRVMMYMEAVKGSPRR